MFQFSLIRQKNCWRSRGPAIYMLRRMVNFQVCLACSKSKFSTSCPVNELVFLSLVISSTCNHFLLELFSLFWLYYIQLTCKYSISTNGIFLLSSTIWPVTALFLLNVGINIWVSHILKDLSIYQHFQVNMINIFKLIILV